MKNVTIKWLEYARADLEAAEVLVRAGKTTHSYQLAVLHCHQAIEKILKTVIVNKGEVPNRIHDLIKLAQDTKIRLSLHYQNYISELNVHYQPCRYPDIPYKRPVLTYTRKTSWYHLKETKKLFRWIEKKIISKK